MGGIEYVYRNGSRLTPWMAHCFDLLDRDLQALFGVRAICTSGIRTYQEQVDIFLARYRLQATGSGKYNDVRWWQGRRYVRVSGLGTVAPPGSSNHEIQLNYYGAMDLADTGGAGIGTMGSERSNWLRANAAAYGLEPEGFKFGEAWHYRVPNIFRAAPTPTTPPAPIPVPVNKGGNMFLIYDAEAGRAVADRQYILVTIDAGQFVLRYLEDKVDRAVVVGQQPNLATTACDRKTFEAFLDQHGYTYKGDLPLIEVKAV